MEISARRRSTLGLALVSAGVFWEAASGYWDVYSHRITFKQFDPWWNPAHLSIYAGVALAIVGLWWSTRGPVGPALRPAFRAMALGVGMQLVAGIFNEAWHRLGGPLLTLEPPHILLVLGMIVAAFGAITGLATLVAAGSERRSLGWRLLSNLGLLLAFAAMWLVAVGSTIFLAFDPAFQAEGPLHPLFTIITAGVGVLVVIPVARAAPWPGFTSALGTLLTAVNWFLLVGYLRIAAYIPWSILPFVVLEPVYFLLRPHLRTWALDVVGGVAFGILNYLASFPFTFELMAPPGLNLDTLLGAVAGAGGALGAGLLIRGTGNWIRRSAEGIMPRPTAK